MQLIRTKISKLFTPENFIISTGILTIIPFIIISYYNHPACDDFWYNIKTRDHGFWNTQLYWYNEWTGRYFSSLILSIIALVSDSFVLYKLIPVLLLILLFISIYYLCSLVLNNFKKKDSLVLAFCILIMYLFQMPSTSEGIYWLASSINYLLSNILTIFLFGFLLKLIATNKLKYLILSIFFTFFVVGLNEISMLVNNFIIGVIFIFKSIQQKKINYSILKVLIFTLIFSLIVFNAPGNSVRSENYLDKNQIFNAIGISLWSVVVFLINWLPFISILALIFFDYFSKHSITKTPKIFNVKPVFVFIVVLAIGFIASFTVCWSTGYVPLTRTVNVTYFYFILGLFYLCFVLHFKSKKEKTYFIRYSKWVKYSLFSIIIIFLFGQENNIRTVYSDLFSGKAYNYNLELKNRYHIIQNNSQDTLYIPTLKFKPATIFFIDISKNPNLKVNEYYSHYWNTTSIILKE